MKKFICVVLILCLISGCAKGTNTDVIEGIDTSGQYQENVKEQENGGSDFVENGNSDQTSEPEPESKPEPEPEPEPTPVPEPTPNPSQNIVTADDEVSDIIDLAPEQEDDGTYLPPDAVTPEYVGNVGTNATTVEITSSNYNTVLLTLPKINIDTLSGNEITSRDEYVSARISVENVENSQRLVPTAVEVRGRGNSTWSFFDKKPYKLRFTMKTDLLGMGAARKWVLLANSIDDTMLRSALAFDLAKNLGVEYVTDFRFVNVFVNGGYKGVYLLCEQTEEGSTRIDVNTSKTGEADTGYVLEMWNDNVTKTDKKTFSIPYVDGILSTCRCVVVSPDEKDINDDQLEFIKEYVRNANHAILKKDWKKINELVDIDTFVNMFLVDTVFLNNDSGYSYYMYKKAGGKLCLGPVWDIDQSAGNSSHGGAGYDGWSRGSKHDWYLALMEIKEFRELVLKRYNEKKDYIHGLVDRVDEYATKYAYDFGMSNYIYNNFGNEKRVRTMPEIYSLKTYSEHLAYLRTWFTNRFLWIDANLKV